MAQPLAPPKPGSLRLRLVSAAVLLPAAILVVWLGSWWLAAFLAVLSGAMCWEWSNLCNPSRIDVWSIMLVAGGAAPLVFVAFGFEGMLWLLAAALVALVALALAGRLEYPAVCIPGLPYIAVGICCIVWLRADPEHGLLTVVWAATAIVATDVGAYFVGRNVGGPKLAPRVSPNKTWSGLFGGMIFAGLTGLIIGVWVGAAWIAMAIGGMAIALISQAGDLIESALKRKFGAKDASQLIPGHGGFLDRFDGYLTAMPAAALMSAFAGGSPVTWQ
ncbi:MAG: phosphatidate cytidylyltransferase [Pseudomonadota bacterium]